MAEIIPLKYDADGHVTQMDLGSDTLPGAGSVSLLIKSITSGPYTLLDADDVLLVNGADITLPYTYTAQKRVDIKNVGPNKIILTAETPGTVEEKATLELKKHNASVTLIRFGDNWYIL